MKHLSIYFSAVAAISGIISAIILFNILLRLNSIPTVADYEASYNYTNSNEPEYVKRMPLIRIQGGSVDADISEPLEVKIKQDEPLQVESR